MTLLPSDPIPSLTNSGSTAGSKTPEDFTDADLAALSIEFETYAAGKIIQWAVDNFAPHLALTASMTDAVLIDLAVKVYPEIEVAFIDTGYHFPETLHTVERVRRKYGLNLKMMTVRHHDEALWESDPENAYRGASALVNVGAISGGFGWRVSRTPHHTDLFLDVRVPPTKAMGVARREVLDFVRTLAERFPAYGVEGEVYVTAPGAEIDEGHELVAAIDASHAEVFGDAPGRDVTRWFSDASALTRYGVPTVNYGTSTGLMDVELGENLDIDGLVKMAHTYALVARRVCG